MTLTKRGLMRLCTLSLAAVTALSVKSYKLMKKADAAERSVNNNYTAAVEELAHSCDSLSNVLEKQLYAGSGQVQQTLAVDLYREAATAKAALARLPVAKLGLENTNKFLSQVGNYSLALSKKLENGEELTNEEYSNIARLSEFSQTLSDRLWELEGEVSGGELTFQHSESMMTDKEPPHVTEGFTDFEGGFDDYPKLIYDGPFSDNIMEQTPKMTENADEVSRESCNTDLPCGMIQECLLFRFLLEHMFTLQSERQYDPVDQIVHRDHDDPERIGKQQDSVYRKDQVVYTVFR